MRAGVTQSVRGRADPRRGARRDPLRLGVGVRRGHDRYPGCLRDLPQRRPDPSLMHGCSVVIYRYTVFYARDVYRYTKHSADDSRGEAFGRDAPTRLSYAVVAGYAFWLYAFGPALALLRTELHFSYTMLGVYSVLWSGGAAGAGLVFAPVTRRLSRASLMRFSALGAAAGMGLFVAARSVTGTLLGAFVAGFAG